MEPFRTLVGLPAIGPWPEQFSATGRGTHRGGFVVEFNPKTSSSWVGNFQRGLTNSDAVLLPNGHSAIVIAGGQGYLIDPKDRRLVGLFGTQLNGGALFSERLEETRRCASRRTQMQANGSASGRPARAKNMSISIT
jgi:hypothetical protein